MTVGVSPYGVMTQVLDYSLEVIKFKLQSLYYVHLRTDNTAALLQGWFWY